MKAIYILIFVLIVAKNGVHSQGSRKNYQTDGQHDLTRMNYNRMNQKSTGTAASKNISNPLPMQKLGISAWGIIAIILSIIVFSTITYYVFMLYPFICKKDQTYDIIELTEVNSVCTVSDNANNMPLYRSSNDISNDVSLNR